MTENISAYVTLLTTSAASILSVPTAVKAPPRGDGQWLVVKRQKLA